ncbi:MAG TPA: NADH-quinone oxidoreductase subunit N [Gemmatimonadaceae bacterium]|nr:NADH-quinone oxidoreductase subunit N [Gemmatimonadaceae bacterium]
MNPYNLAVPAQLMAALGPELLLSVGAILLMLWAAWRPDSAQHQRSVGIGSMVVTVLTGIAAIWYLYQQRTATEGPIAVDNFRWMADAVILLGTLFAVALTIDDNDRQGITAGESHVLILFASLGMMLLAAARDLMIVFLGIELMSISIYALAGINRRSARGAEGALKYFLLGAFSTAFLLYGIALVYGATGTTSLPLIAGRIHALDLLHSPLLLVGIAMLLVGFGFKVASVPFHMWAPDVYDGSPSPVTAYMAATVKAAAFAAFIRVWSEGFPEAFAQWHRAVAALAVATMVFGNAIGLAQRNIKRMLAYSSIAHAGFILVALAGGSVWSGPAALFYLLVYTLATFGAFAVIVLVARQGDSPVLIRDFEGLWSVRPWLALSMGIMMLALLGFPIFGGGGFFAKWYVLQAAMLAPAPQVTLAVVMVLTTVVSAGYYLYVVMVMFMKPRAEDAAAPAQAPFWTRAVMLVSVLAILALGVLPDRFSRLARAGVIIAHPDTTALAATPAADPAAVSQQ